MRGCSPFLFFLFFYFSFSPRSRFWDRPRLEEQGSTRSLSGKKLCPRGREVCQILCMTFFSMLTSTPISALTHTNTNTKICVLEVAFELSQTTRLHHYYKEPHANTRLGRFFGVSSACPGPPNSMGRLWKED